MSHLEFQGIGLPEERPPLLWPEYTSAPAVHICGHVGIPDYLPRWQLPAAWSEKTGLDCWEQALPSCKQLNPFGVTERRGL